LTILDECAPAGSGVLYGILRNSGYKIRKLEETEKEVHMIREFFLPTRQTCEAGGNGEGIKIEQ